MGLSTVGPTAPDPGDVRVRLLGAVGATVGTTDVDLGGPKELAVLALLASRPASRSRDGLIDDLWGDAPPKTATKTLQTYISHVRAAFARITDREVVVTGPSGYSLSTAVGTDVEEVEALMAAAQGTAGADPASAVASLEAAANHFDGEPLSGVADARRLDGLREAYRQLRWNVVEALARARLDHGDEHALTTDLHRWVDENPYREGLWSALMLALYRCGRQSDALAAFQRARGHLVEGLGVEPGPELADLERLILQQDRRLLERGRRRDLHAESETLTFLFTDIERSTVLWDLEPEAMRDAVAHHDELIEDSASIVGGRTFSAAGDGFGIAFARAEDAARAACDVQRRFAEERWPTSTPIRVRIGLHTGTAEARGGSFFGAAVNRAARVMDLGRGGQVLCSAATAALLADLPEEEAIVVPLVERQLRGLARPELIHQLSPHGLDEDFPAPGRTDDVRRLLPTPLDSLHGRQAELAEVEALVADHRLVTLTGVGGTGKTRLALETAIALREVFGDGAAWVELAAVEADGIDAAVAGALGITLAGTADQHRTQLLTALRRRHVLLVLDNCEHLVGAAATFVEAALRAVPRLSILTTSREPLGVAGERIYVVPSLPLPTGAATSPAEALLRARAEEAGATIPGDPAQRAAMQAICVRLDGVPLALEFAAAQLPAYSPTEVLDRLEDHFRLFGRPAGSSVARQQTIETTIDWSHRLLDEHEQALLRRLAVFRDGFDAAAAEAVAPAELGPAEGAAVLDRLRWKSLVTCLPGGSTTRFKLLEPVRQFAHARLRADDEVDDALARHAAHHLRMLRRPRTGDRYTDEAERLARVAIDLANVRLAAETLHQHDPEGLLVLFDALRGWFTVPGGTGDIPGLALDVLQREGEPIDPLVEGHAANTLGMIEMYLPQPEPSPWFTRALEMASLTGDDTLRAETEFHLGTWHHVWGAPESAELHLSRATTLHHALGNTGSWAINLAWLAVVMALGGRADEALPMALRADQVARDTKMNPGLVVAPLAYVAAVAGDGPTLDHALERLQGTSDAHVLGTQAALVAGRLPVASALLLPALRAASAGSAPDPTLAIVVAVVCRRAGHEDLAALWVASAHAQEAAPAGSTEVLRMQHTIQVALTDEERSGWLTQQARARLGDRFDAVVERYRSDPWAPALETIDALDPLQGS